MNTQELQTHFGDCNLPVRFYDARPVTMHFPTPYTPTIDDLFYVDVLKPGQRQQHFRLFVDERADLLVMNKQADERRMLVQVRWTPENAEKAFKRHLLLGHDERQLFVVNARTASTVQATLDNLKPFAVRVAERRGRKVIRQGDWFFIPMRAGFAPTSDMLMYSNQMLGGPNARRHGIVVGNPHVADEQALKFSPVYGYVNRKWATIGTEITAICVRGKIRHSEHSTVELLTWHQAIQSRPDGSRAIGYRD